jgi:8-oxo-dGTP diphosphatase
MIKVVCGIIYHGNKIFIAKRKPGKSMGGLWEFPGGKIENNESEVDCLQRELLEELEMEVDGLNKYVQTIYSNDNFSLELISYKCNLKKWNGNLNDHDDFKWIYTSQLKEFDLSPADIFISESLLK